MHFKNRLLIILSIIQNQRRVKAKKGENRKQAEEEEAARKEMVLSEYRYDYSLIELTK